MTPHTQLRRLFLSLAVTAAGLAGLGLPAAALAKPVGAPAAKSTAEALARRASIGAAFSPGTAGGLTVGTLVPDGAGARAGLKTGDELLSLAGARTPTTEALMLALRSPKGATLPIEVMREGKTITLELPVVAAPAEVMPGSTLRYDSVGVPAGYRLRTIITEPEAGTGADKVVGGKRPAFLFVQGIYCASIDRPAPSARDAVDTRLVRAMADAGFITMRVDKPGLGDSEGPPCGDINFSTELAGYIAAAEQLRSLPGVDPERVYLFGHSMGGVMAPFITEKVPVKGVIVYGTLMRTWLEYSLENTRRQAGLQGANPGEVTEMVQAQSRIDSMMLLEKMTLGQIWDKHPELKPPQESPMMTRDRLSSRHMSFYHELQDINIAAAWTRATGHALAIHGEYDWVTTAGDHEAIATVVSGRTTNKATATMLSLPKADHAFTTHETLQASLGAMGQGKWADTLPTAVLNWIASLDKPAGENKAAAASKPTLQAGEQPAAGATAAVAPTAAPKWTKLTTERYPGKQDDIAFISPTTGWYVNGAGKIFKTSDGGATWTQQLHKPGTYFRCIAFVDEKIGLAGNIGPGYFPNVTDTTPLYRTTDGGATWSAVTTIQGPPVVGLCAIEVVRTAFINAGKLDTRTRLVAGGRVGAPAAYIYSDDLGETWQQVKLPEQCKMVFDVHFTDRDHGFIAGATSADVAEANALILATSDGGMTWNTVYKSARPYELTWKISFPTKTTGYVTIQAYNPDTSVSQRFIAKTTDGGKTFSEIPLVDDHRVRQFGIAFTSENEGWVGAMPGGFYTADGGKTWSPAGFGNAVNKIRVVRGTADAPASSSALTLYSIGVDVHKLERK
jgi:photosystem II stability/assembly factor-like uncharacterized protein/pimeloyl-ACP methyl ester carboxylesterase